MSPARRAIVIDAMIEVLPRRMKNLSCKRRGQIDDDCFVGCGSSDRDCLTALCERLLDVIEREGGDP